MSGHRPWSEVKHRKPGLLGRLPQRPPEKRYAISWAHEQLAAPLPPPKYPIDVTHGLQDWGILGNDRYGDCAVAGRYHLSLSTALAASQPEPHFTDEQVIQEYLTYTGGQDQGAVLADYLLWLYEQELILAFAPVDVSNIEHADALMAMFNGLYCGMSLTADAPALFAEHQPWTTANGESPVSSMGHCIVKVAADGETDKWVTWGAVQPSTSEWTRSCLQEAWCIVTNEEQLAAFEPSLLQEIEALGGQG